MGTFLALQHIPYEDTKIHGVFSDRDQAEQCLAKVVADTVDRHADPIEEVLLTLASSWCVEEWIVDGSRKEEYGITNELMIELVKKLRE